MKIDKKIEAKFLRKKGYSVNQIADKLQVSKGSVSKWLKRMALPPEQLRQVRMRSHSPEAVKKQQQTRQKNQG